ncbi:MAG: response regulator [Bacteriovoracaceae bacterium]
MNHSRENVLLIDDNCHLREVIGIFLRDEGYGVLEAANGKVALELLNGLPKKDIPSCVVLDLKMPVMSGDEFLEALETEASTELRNIPVIIYSAEGKLRRHRQVVARLEKPVSIEILCGAIKGCTGILDQKCT